MTSYFTHKSKNTQHAYFPNNSICKNTVARQQGNACYYLIAVKLRLIQICEVTVTMETTYYNGEHQHFPRICW